MPLLPHYLLCLYVVIHTDKYMYCKATKSNTMSGEEKGTHKYLHRRPKHILLWSHTLLLQCFFLCAIFSLLYLPSPDEVAPWPPSLSESSAGKLVDQEHFWTVRYWSVCIYILQINFFLKKEGTHFLPTAVFLSNPFWHNVTSPKYWSWLQ
jgi:hypothetical protein